MPNDLPSNIELEPLPFEEAIAFFTGKVPMSAAEFYALEEKARNRAFTVSRVSAADIIVDIQQAVKTAIDQGETLRDFQGRLSEIMAARGWEGLAPWHAETVFRNNIQTAYSVGRHDQMMDMSDRFYGQYDAVNDLATRPAHAALDGKIFPLDHPFWETWWPPNGHRCRCSVNPVHKYVVEQEGLTIETEDPTGGLIEPVDPKTGRKMPARPLIPDPGWDHNPAVRPWQPDLDKYPGVLKNAMQNEGVGKIKPLSIESLSDVEKVVAEKLTPLTRLPEGQKLELSWLAFGNFMSTNSKGRIAISTYTFEDASGFSPAEDLLNAFKNLGKTELTFNQEYALESLWHEVMHHRQIVTQVFDIPVHKGLLMEVMNQWVSRRTYDKMLDVLGGFTPKWRHTVKVQGYGYPSYIRRFDKLLKKLGLIDGDLVARLYRIHSEVDRYEYAQPVAQYLAEAADRLNDREKILDVLNNLRYQEVFEEILSQI